MTEKRREMMAAVQEKRKREGKKGAWHAGRDKCELEVSKTPRCEDSKVSYPTKQQVHTNYAMWPRGSCSLWVLWRKEASVALHKQGSKSTKAKGKRLPASFKIFLQKLQNCLNTQMK